MLRKETRAADEDLVFTAERSSRIDMSNLMSRVLKPAAVRAGIGQWIKTPKGRRADTWVGFHTFRHTCASMLFRAGWNAAQVQRHLGHHKASFTLDTYIHLLDEDVPEPTFFDALGKGDKKPEADVREVAVWARRVSREGVDSLYGQPHRKDPQVVEARKEAGRNEARYRRAVRRSGAMSNV